MYRLVPAKRCFTRSVCAETTSGEPTQAQARAHAVLVLRVPADAGVDPMGRVVAATGVPADRLSLPGYGHGPGP